MNASERDYIWLIPLVVRCGVDFSAVSFLPLRVRDNDMARKLDDEVDWENDLLDLTKETTYDEKVELLGKLLDSESTLFSKKMRDWLVKDGTARPASIFFFMALVDYLHD